MYLKIESEELNIHDSDNYNYFCCELKLEDEHYILIRGDIDKLDTLENMDDVFANISDINSYEYTLSNHMFIKHVSSEDRIKLYAVILKTYLEKFENITSDHNTFNDTQARSLNDKINQIFDITARNELRRKSQEIYKVLFSDNLVHNFGYGEGFDMLIYSDNLVYNFGYGEGFDMLIYLAGLHNLYVNINDVLSNINETPDVFFKNIVEPMIEKYLSIYKENNEFIENVKEKHSIFDYLKIENKVNVAIFNLSMYKYNTNIFKLITSNKLSHEDWYTLILMHVDKILTDYLHKNYIYLHRRVKIKSILLKMEEQNNEKS